MNAFILAGPQVRKHGLRRPAAKVSRLQTIQTAKVEGSGTSCTTSVGVKRRFVLLSLEPGLSGSPNWARTCWKPTAEGAFGVMADVIAGAQSYRTLNWRLVQTLEIGLLWRMLRMRMPGPPRSRTSRESAIDSPPAGNQAASAAPAARR